MRTFLVLGMIVLAALVPLVAVPVEAMAFQARVVCNADFELAAADAPSVALLALTFFRAPPSSR